MTYAALTDNELFTVLLAVLIVAVIVWIVLAVSGRRG